MKVFVAILVLAACLSAEGRVFKSSSPAVTLKEYYASHPLNSRIISGQLAQVGQFPYQAALWMYNSDGTMSFCGGSLISNKWVLTAAHCAEGVTAWDIKLGGVRLDVGESGQYYQKSTRGIIHPNYNSYLNNDIALIELPIPVTQTNNIRIMRLPTRSEANDALLNQKVTASGWGKISDSATGVTNFLNYVSIDTISNSECVNYYGSQTIISSTLCCKGHPEHSTCGGDSGGPLVRVAADGYLTQVGVVSFVSRAGCASGAPSGFVRTASYLDWISQNTGIPVRP